MTELLQQVVAQVTQLPPEEQDAIATLIQREEDEREWERIVRTPASQRFLQHLVAEARSEDAAGQTQAADDHW